MGMLGWPHLLLIVAVIILLFGATKLPALARSIGQSARVFKGEMKAMQDDDAPTTFDEGTLPSGKGTSASAGAPR
jgi:sec-independent protein translocase protein TatA